MLHLFTGLPGSQKTANMLHYVFTRLDGDWKGRQVYYYNIRGCAVDDWIELNEEEARRWYELPEGSVILLDEAQTLFRPIQRKDKEAPKEVTELETHRHHGYDLFLTTQHPMLIHTAVRRQVQMHWHLERPFGMKTKAYKWEKCVHDPDDHFARKDAAVEGVKVPPTVFSRYTSTVLDTQKKRIPKKLIMALGMLLAVIGGFSYFVWSYMQRTEPENVAAETSQSSSPLSAMTQQITPAREKDESAFKPVYPLDPDEYLKLHTPRLPGQPNTAPIYDDLMKPQVAPKTLCYGYRKDGKDHCKCVTQQMTPIPMGFDQCKHIVNNGLWDPTLKPARYNARGRLLSDQEGGRVAPRERQSAPARVAPDPETAL